MFKVGNVWLFLLFIALVSGGYAYFQSLKDFKNEVLAQSREYSKQTEAKENELKNALLSANQTALHESDNINNRFNDLLRGLERLHGGSSSSAQQVPTASPVRTGAGDTTTAQPLRASGAIHQKLLKCEARLLYEAKEYDILATHYNELLKIYEQARLANENTRTK